jgi:hypothetical protein
VNRILSLLSIAVATMVAMLGMDLANAGSSSAPAPRPSAQVSAPFAGVRLQGSLSDAGGSPLNGQFAVTVRIYKAASGGTPVYSESFNQSISAGALDLLIGAGMGTISDDLVAALSLDSGDATYERYLTMQIEGDSQELAPRRRLTAGAIAAAAMNAQSLGGTSASEYVTAIKLSDDTGVALVTGGPTFATDQEVSALLASINATLAALCAEHPSVCP